MAIPPDTTPTPAKKPAREDAEQDGFMREVDEAVRQDQMEQAAKKYGIPIAIVVVLVLAAAGGWLWFDGQRNAEAAERSERLTLALDRIQGQNPESANDILATLAEEDGGGASVLAALTQAGIMASEGDTDEAAAAYAAIAANADAPQELRDLASVREVSLRFDDLPPEDVIARLEPLAVPGNPWFGSAGELVAIAYLKQNEPGRAGPLLAEISKDEDVPQTIRRRTRQMAGLLGVDAIDDVEEALNESQLAARGQAGAAEPGAPEQ